MAEKARIFILQLSVRLLCRLASTGSAWDPEYGLVIRMLIMSVSAPIFANGRGITDFAESPYMRDILCNK